MYSQIYAFEVLPERREEFIALMHRHITECLREEPGLLDFRFFQDETNPNRFYDFETYTDEAALAAHRAPGSALARNGPLARPMMVGVQGTFIARGFQQQMSAAEVPTPEP
jgi:autoinducer 2-degrading protein